MIITVRVDGGLAQFPGLTRPISVDTADADDEAARALTTMLADLDFFALPLEIGVAGDGRPTTSITVVDGARTHTVRVHDPSPASTPGRLIAVVLRLARR